MTFFWYDDEQLSSIYGKALLGINKDSPRELNGVISEDACRDNLSNKDIVSKLLLNMDHDSCKEMISKLLSHQDIWRCVQEVLMESGLSPRAPILPQAKFK
jgi:hypothetical protein